MSNNTASIVSKMGSFCTTLRDNGGEKSMMLIEYVQNLHIANVFAEGRLSQFGAKCTLRINPTTKDFLVVQQEGKA
ncbi:MAG: hypothetical protein KGZ93_08095 [Actinobacteria bacterium]|nr:hypothetical protein [Actinomycetota bacterium]